MKMGAGARLKAGRKYGTPRFSCSTDYCDGGENRQGFEISEEKIEK